MKKAEVWIYISLNEKLPSLKPENEASEGIRWRVKMDGTGDTSIFSKTTQTKTTNK